MRNKKLVRSSIALSVMLALTACDLSSDNDFVPTVTPPTDGGTTDQVVQVDGSVVKGALRNALVTAFDGADVELASTITDENGDYTLDIPADFNGAIRITVVATADSTMVCDTGNCGDGVSFGDEITDVTGLELSSVAFFDATQVANDGEDTTKVTVSIPVNALTTLTTKRMLANTSLAQLSTSGKTGFDTASKVATRAVGISLGLTADNIPDNFLTMDIIDPTTISDLSATQAQELSALQTQISLFNSAILETIIESQAGAGSLGLGATINDSLTTLSNAIESLQTSVLNEFLTLTAENIQQLINNPIFQQEFAQLRTKLVDEGVNTELAVNEETLENSNTTEEEIDEEQLSQVVDAANRLSDLINASEGELTEDDVNDIIDSAAEAAAEAAAQAAAEAAAQAATEAAAAAEAAALAAANTSAIDTTNDFFNANGLSVEANKQIIKASGDIRSAVQYALTNSSVVDDTADNEEEVITYIVPADGSNSAGNRYDVYIKENSGASTGNGLTVASSSTYFSGVITNFPITTANAATVDCTSTATAVTCVDETGTELNDMQTAVQFTVGYDFNSSPASTEATITSELIAKGVMVMDNVKLELAGDNDTGYASATIKSYDTTLGYQDINVSMNDSALEVSLPSFSLYESNGTWDKEIAGSAVLDFDFYGANHANGNMINHGKATITPTYIRGVSGSDYEMIGEAFMYNQTTDGTTRKYITKGFDLNKGGYNLSLDQIANLISSELNEAVWCGDWTGSISVSPYTVGTFEKPSTCPVSAAAAASSYYFDINGTQVKPSNLVGIMDALSVYFDQKDN
jgi:ribosomal protein L12E/L44/L45/RPP1/RPP2